MYMVLSSSDLDKNYSGGQVDALRKAINAQDNVAYIPYEFNCAVRASAEKICPQLIVDGTESCGNEELRQETTRHQHFQTSKMRRDWTGYHRRNEGVSDTILP